MRKLRSVVILSTIFVVMLVAFSTQAFAQVAAEPIPKPSNFNGKIIETAKYATIQIEVFKGTDVEVYVVNKSNSKYSYSKHFTYDAKYKIQLYPGKNVVKIKTYYKKTLKTYAATYEYVVSPQKEKLTPAAPLIKTTDKNKLVVDGSFDYVSLRFKVYEGTYAKVQVRNSADTATVETATIEPSENEGVALKAGKHKVILETFSKATKKRVESRPQTFIYNVTNKATSSSGGNKG